MAKIRIKRSCESYSIFVIINQAVFSLNGIDKIENGATGCPILLVSTVEYRILYTKGNWIEGKNVIMLYYIFFGFLDIGETTLSGCLLNLRYIGNSADTLFYSLNYTVENTEFNNLYF